VSGAGSAGTGAAGSGGTFVDGGNCYTGTAPPPTSEVMGTSFEAWEGEPVHACLYPSQSFPWSCPSAVVRGGRFTLTAAVCTAGRWEITVGAPGHQVGCSPSANVVTPANCWCSSGWGPDPGAAGGPGLGCDAGSRDAAADVVDATVE
jgi:hypothetical protein